MKNIIKLLIITLFIILSVFLLVKSSLKAPSKEVNGMKISSPAFEHNDTIPSKYTCDGEDISPPLVFEEIPENTVSLALIADDPDAPMGTWVHWVMYNIPATSGGLAENIPPDSELKDGSLQGITDFRRIGYGGPCPPSGAHRYFFKLYALDKKLDLPSGAAKQQVEAAIKGHIIAQDHIIGIYKRNK